MSFSMADMLQEALIKSDNVDVRGDEVSTTSVAGGSLLGDPYWVLGHLTGVRLAILRFALSRSRPS
jgi:hypothetical protein